MNLAVHEDKFLSGGRNRRSWTGLLCSRKAHRLSKNDCNACCRAKPKQLAARETVFVSHRVPPWQAVCGGGLFLEAARCRACALRTARVSLVARRTGAHRAPSCAIHYAAGEPGFFFCRSNSFMKAASRSATYAL